MDRLRWKRNSRLSGRRFAAEDCVFNRGQGDEEEEEGSQKRRPGEEG